MCPSPERACRGPSFRAAAGLAAPLAVSAALTVAVRAGQGESAQKPVFRSDVNVVVVEATVLERSGAVARGLGPADFQVEIGGRAREVLSAELVEHAGAATAAPRVDPDITTNATAATGRLVLLIVDQGSLRSDNRSLLEGARRWLSMLGGADRVGLVTIPQPGPRVEFTTDRTQVADALGRIPPAMPPIPPPFSQYDVSLWESIRITEGDSFVRTEVISRECTSRQPNCPDDIDANASALALDAQARVDPVLGAVRGLVQGLGALPGPKHVVLLSAGWPLDERKAAIETSAIAADAALSNTTVHTFSAEQFAFAASLSRPSVRTSMDREMVLSNVEMLSGMTGGRSARLAGDGALAFKSLTAGLSGYYRLGVRPAPEDLDGKPHRISVKVSRSGVTLSAHRKVMAGTRSAPPAPVDSASAMRDALRSRTPLTGVGLRVTSYVLHGETAGPEVRVVVAGDVSQAAVGPATVAAALYDLDGKAVVGAEVPVQVPADRPGRLTATLAVPPGAYIMRLAARDAQGRLGSLERAIDARWRKIGIVETTGLSLFRSEPGGRPEPMLDVVSTTDHVVAQVSFAAPVSSLTTQVRFDVLGEGGTAPLLRLAGRIARTSSGGTVAQETVPVAVLPPGRYTLAASILPGKAPPFTRAFIVAPATPVAPAPTPAAGDGAGAGETAAAGAPPAAAAGASRAALRTLPKAPRFSTAAVFDPLFVAPAFERLAGRPDVSAARDALDKVKAGPWPTDGDRGPLAAVPVASNFVAGLGRLQRGDLEEAANAFRAALRAAPDFSPAMVYLGACYAAGGKDREAASAWQTALLRERDSRVLQRLAIEAWLRADRAAAAQALVKQARQRWPDDPSFVALAAQVALADGRRQEGLELVATLADPGDLLLLQALAALYEAAQEGQPIWDADRDLARMRALREAYAKANGESLGLVDAWIAGVASNQP